MPGQPETNYEIRIAGNLDPCWTGWFPRLRFEHRGGDTVIVGPIADQAALHAVLDRIRDLGITLISVRRLGANPPDKPD